MSKRHLQLLITLLVIISGLFATLSGAPPSAPQGSTAEEILECARANWVEGTFHGTVKIDLFRPDFSKTYRMEIWSEGEEKAMVLIIEPVAEAKSGYLELGDELWYYTPDAGVAVSLPASALSENLFGSDLSFEDLSRGTLSEDFLIELLGSRAAAPEESEVNNDVVHLVRLTPKPETPVVYGKLEMVVRASDCATLTINYFDQRETLIRQALFSQFVLAGKEGHERVIPLRAVFDDLLSEGSRTVQVIESYELDIEIPAARFTLDCLTQEKCG